MERRGTIPVGLPQTNPVESYWQIDKSDIADLRTTEELPSSADIIIIGSGVSGATVAYNLLSANPHTKIVLLEARQAASGASGRNGGHTKTASYRSFHDNVRTVGEDDAVKVARLEYNCMVAVHNFIRKTGIDCDSKRCDTVDVFYDDKHWQDAHTSVQLMQALMGGDDPAPVHTFYDAEETASTFLAPNSLGSLKYEAGSLNAYKFTIGLLKLGLSKGLNLQCNTPADALKQTSQSGHPSWCVKTSRGTITAPKVLIATNGYSARLIPELQGVIVPFRGIVTAQRPGRSMPQNGLPTTFSFVYSEGYEYMISRPAGSKFEGDIVIGGGLSKGPGSDLEEFGNTNDTVIETDIEKYLFDCTNTYFGDNWGADHPDGRIRKTWSGIMGHSADGHPLVGPMPGQDGLFIDASFQGHGMVLCFLCAKAVAQMILGNDDDELKSWLPNAYRVTEERLKTKFTGH